MSGHLSVPSVENDIRQVQCEQHTWTAISMERLLRYFIHNVIEAIDLVSLKCLFNFSFFQQCTLCDKRLQSRTSYRNHMKRHTDEKKFNCVFCQKKFFTRYHLKLHQSKIHKDLVAEDENIVLEEGVDESDDMIVYE